eukprot:1980345-Lingulodinium_polyedra.AAC.1
MLPADRHGRPPGSRSRPGSVPRHAEAGCWMLDVRGTPAPGDRSDRAGRGRRRLGPGPPR